MQIHILITPDLRPIPENITVDHEWGNLTICTYNAGEEKPNTLDSNHHVTGLHAFVSGEKQALIDWLGKFDGFWRGSGSPMMESFRICHIKQELKTQSENSLRFIIHG